MPSIWACLSIGYTTRAHLTHFTDVGLVLRVFFRSVLLFLDADFFFVVVFLVFAETAEFV